MWKIYHIPSGQIVKGGFDSEDQAKEWLERRRDLMEEDHDVEEMDEEEEEEYLDQIEELADRPLTEDPYDDDDDDDDGRLGPGLSLPDEELTGEDGDLDDDGF